MKNLCFPYGKLMFSRFQAITFTMKIYKKTDMEQQGIFDRKKGGCSRIFEAFGRLWAYFCPPFARLFRGRISKRKKRGLCPDLGPPLARPVEQPTKDYDARRNARGGFEKPFRPEWARQDSVLDSDTARPLPAGARRILCQIPIPDTPRIPPGHPT